jgi:Domain of unknown function (DUF4157)
VDRGGRTAEAVAKTEARASACAAPPVARLGPSNASPLLHLQRAAGNQAVLSLCRSGHIQPKLRISQPSDPFELEADRVADQVMRMPLDKTWSTAPPRIQRKCAACASGGAPCSECAGEEEDLHIHRKEQSGSAGGKTSVADDFVSGLGPGQPLDAATRAFFEPRFGHDFSAVRIHTDACAAESARAVDARAFTLGSNIVFGRSEHHPSSPTGMRLLSHELAHVVQQSASNPPAAVHRQPKDPPVHPSPMFGGMGKGAREGYPHERWSDEIERQYRLRGDFETAAAIRKCRDDGGKACQIILTASDTMRLLDLAVSSKGDETKIRAGLGSAVPALGMLAAGPAVAPPTPPPGLFPPPVVAPPPVVPPIVTPPAVPPTAAVPAAELGTEAGTAASAGLGLEAIVATAGIAAIVAICVVAGYELWKLGKFQEELRAKGFIIIGDPLAVCIGGCHLPSRPQTPDFRGVPNLPDRPFFPPTGTDTAIERWIRDTTPKATTKPTPFPVPRVEPKEKDRRKECMEIHPSALSCGPLAGGAEAREEAVMMYLLGLGYDFTDILDIHCEKQSDFGPGVIRDCGLAPGESWHCTAKLRRGSVVVSIFGCLCCQEDGSTSWEWRGAHISPGK